MSTVVITTAEETNLIREAGLVVFFVTKENTLFVVSQIVRPAITRFAGI